ITHRMIKAALAGAQQPYAENELDDLARHCTEAEDAANKVERQVRKSAAAMLLSPRVGERFDGVVTGASSKGIWVRIFHPPVEGKLIQDRKSTRLNSSHLVISYAVFCLKKKNKQINQKQK